MPIFATTKKLQQHQVTRLQKKNNKFYNCVVAKKNYENPIMQQWGIISARQCLLRIKKKLQWQLSKCARRFSGGNTNCHWCLIGLIQFKFLLKIRKRTRVNFKTASKWIDVRPRTASSTHCPWLRSLRWPAVL